MKFEEIIKNIKNTGKDLKQEAQRKIDTKTKPPGSLGELEKIAVKTALIQNNLKPEINNKTMFVFAGDHGIAIEGVSAFPAEVTPQMVLNFINGGAAINVLCRMNNIKLEVIDMGVNYDFGDNKQIVHKKVAMGTKNFLKEPAMTKAEAVDAIQKGIDVFESSYKKTKIDIIGLGDMGIGNTTSSSAIISTITGASPEMTTGRGTGVDDAGLKNKIEIIKNALALHKPKKDDALDILQKIGGFEIGGIAGAVLAAASYKVPVLLDGIISTAGGLLAYQLCPPAGDYMFSAHRSVESGQMAALEHMKLTAILDLNMRLGEGTGAALAMNIIEASCRIMCEMASFEEAGVSNKE